MSLFSFGSKLPDLRVALSGMQPRLDTIFGSDRYALWLMHDDCCRLTTDQLEVTFTLEQNGLLLSMISLVDPPEGTEAIGQLDLWSAFLKMTEIREPVGDGGRVIASIKEQVERAVGMLANFNERIFSDARTTRDAAFFIEGYSVAYNQYL